MASQADHPPAGPQIQLRAGGHDLQRAVAGEDEQRDHAVGFSATEIVGGQLDDPGPRVEPPAELRNRSAPVRTGGRPPHMPAPGQGCQGPVPGDKPGRCPAPGELEAARALKSSLLVMTSALLTSSSSASRVSTNPELRVARVQSGIARRFLLRRLTGPDAHSDSGGLECQGDTPGPGVSASHKITGAAAPAIPSRRRPVRRSAHRGRQSQR